MLKRRKVHTAAKYFLRPHLQSKDFRQIYWQGFNLQENRPGQNPHRYTPETPAIRQTRLSKGRFRSSGGFGQAEGRIPY